MNIVFVSREYPPSKRVGGIGFYVRDIAGALVARGANVWVIAASDDTKKHEEYIDKNGAKIIRLRGGDFCVEKMNPVIRRLHGKIRSYTRYFSYRNCVANKLNELHASVGIDVVEFAEFGNESFVWLKKFNNVPSIIRLHGPTLLDRNSSTGLASPLKSPALKLFGELELRSLPLATAISSPSQAMADWVLTRTKNITIKPIPNSIKVSWWQENALTSKIAEPAYKKANEIHLFSAGTISLGKGHQELFKAACLLRKDGLNIHLTLAGRLTKFGHILKKLSESPEYRTWLKVIDFADQATLAKFYSQADITVFPSRWEPFGLVCAEAMACRALVLASNAGGMCEIVEHGKSGFLISPGNPNSLAEEIKNTLQLPNEKKLHLRNNAEMRAIELFDIDTIANQQIDFYKKIASSEI